MYFITVHLVDEIFLTFLLLSQIDFFQLKAKQNCSTFLSTNKRQDKNQETRYDIKYKVQRGKDSWTNFTYANDKNKTKSKECWTALMREDENPKRHLTLQRSIKGKFA